MAFGITDLTVKASKILRRKYSSGITERCNPRRRKAFGKKKIFALYQHVCHTQPAFPIRKL